MLILKNISGSYDKKNNIVENINLILEPKRIMGIIGKNGSGKSSLAKTIMNIIFKTNGSIFFNNKDITNEPTFKISNKGIGYLHQGAKIFPSLTIKENIKISLPFSINIDAAISKLQIYFKNIFDLQRVNIKAGYLSGGEQHQLAFAMIISRNPSLLILDEPSAGLSPQNISNFYKFLIDYYENNEISMLIVEQNHKILQKITKNIIEIQNGKIIK